ncbi:MAG: FtsW/RodA/SpoVE family cell cycle protein [Bacteroidales bacterium]|jgi:cell division protein FtsW|nr:FtsW/RodA/SpoVE family cell cycle protein [Bacteroidales bacterium]
MKLRASNIKLKGDKVIWIVFILLSVLSIVEVFSAMGNLVYSNQVPANPITLLAKHFLMIAAGFVVAYTFQNFRYTLLSKLLKPTLILSVLLVIVAFAIGMYYDSLKTLQQDDVRLTGRWIWLPMGFSFQPVEMVKYVTIMYVAMQLTLNNDKIRTYAVFKKLIITISVVCVFVLASNASNAIILFTTSFILLFIAGAKIKHLINTLLLLAAAGTVVVLLVTAFPQLGNKPPLGRVVTVINRVKGNNETENGDVKDRTHQTHVTQVAIGNAGVLGLGIGNSVMANHQKQAHDDFLFMVIVEEGGFLLGFVVLLLYMVLVYRCFAIAKKAKGLFGALVALGVGLVFVIQALIHISVSVGLMPVTGQTLPFISKGGTSQLFACFALGVVLNISATGEKDDVYKDDLQDKTDVTSEEPNESTDEEKEGTDQK